MNTDNIGVIKSYKKFCPECKKQLVKTEYINEERYHCYDGDCSIDEMSYPMIGTTK